MPSRLAIEFLHANDAEIKSCGVKKKHRTVIPNKEIFKKLTSLYPTDKMEHEFEVWLSDVIYWLDVLKNLPKITIMSRDEMAENRRNKIVHEQVRSLFTSENRPLYLRISYGKAEKLATYLANNQLDYLGDPIQSE